MGETILLVSFGLLFLASVAAYIWVARRGNKVRESQLERMILIMQEKERATKEEALLTEERAALLDQYEQKLNEKSEIIDGKKLVVEKTTESEEKERKEVHIGPTD